MTDLNFFLANLTFEQFSTLMAAWFSFCGMVFAAYQVYRAFKVRTKSNPHKAK